jgi:hypothetical protein
MEQDLEITAKSVLHMVRTQMSPGFPQEAAGIQSNSAARIVATFRDRFEKACDAGVWKGLSNLFLEPANPFDVKARRQLRQEALVLGCGSPKNACVDLMPVFPYR